MKTAAMIVIGDEILSGRTRDANMHTLAKTLNSHGIILREARFIADHIEVIADTVNLLRQKVDYVFTSGGIGPTHDDKTADAVAHAFGVKIDIRSDARDILEAYYGDRLNEARLRMARIPETAILIANPVSQAPGFQLENVYVMAGIPAVFNAMLENVMTQIEGGTPLLCFSLSTELYEGDIASALANLDRRHPDVQIGCYPFFQSKGSGVTLVVKSADEIALKTCIIELRQVLRDLGAQSIHEITS